MSTRKPPRGYRIRKVGEIRCATDKVFTFNFDAEDLTHPYPRRWKNPGSYDCMKIGLPWRGRSEGREIWAAKITKRKPVKRSKKK